MRLGEPTVNVDRILDTLNRFQVDYLLIGGMNFLLRHEPVLTYDVDIWIEDSDANRRRCEQALCELEAEWGRTDEDWKPVRQQPGGWLDVQGVYCLTSPQGAIDVFRRVAGLDTWQASRDFGVQETTASGIPYVGLSDADMLRCQVALDEPLQKRDRIRTLTEAMRKGASDGR
jgi:hypothetical protein